MSIISIKQERGKTPERRGEAKMNGYWTGKHWMIFSLENKIKSSENGSSFLAAYGNECPRSYLPQNLSIGEFSHCKMCIFIYNLPQKYFSL